MSERTERQYGWMWLHALELADRAEGLQRRFLRYLGPRAGAVAWEPPADVIETARGLTVTFALPGVPPSDIEIHLERSALTVSARRPLRLPEGNAVIRRLEIPHGQFFRQLTLSGPPLQVAESRCLHGCLEIRLVRAGEYP